MSGGVRPLLWGILVVLVLAAGGYAFFARGKSAPNIGSRFTEAGVCLACKDDAQVTYPREEPAPHRCPKCGQQAFYPWYYCFDCKKRFVPALTTRDAGGPPRVPLSVACPMCFGTSVSPYLANQPGYELSGPDGPLPKWP